jgi:hypothetical protein
MNYTVNLIIAGFLSFSLVYAFTTTFKMTYEVRDVIKLVFTMVVIYSIAFTNRITVIITFVVSGLIFTGSLIYFINKPTVFNIIYSKAASTLLWLDGYINYEVPLNLEFQKYTFLTLGILIPLVVYIVSVKKFNFYVLLIGGLSLFVGQWMIDYFVIYIPFYIFMFFLIISYFKHVYLRSSGKDSDTLRNSHAAFLLLCAPVCLFVFLLAYFMPASEKPIEWDWMDSKINSIESFVNSKFSNVNSEYFTIGSTGFNEESARLGGNVRVDDTLVMKVDSPVGGIYLKGAVRDQYTGFSWESTNTERMALGQKLQLVDLNTDFFKVLEESNILSERSSDLNKLLNKTSINITYENLKTKTLFIPSKTESIVFDEQVSVFMDNYGIPSSEKFLRKQFKYNVELYNINTSNESLADLLRNSSQGMYNIYVQTEDKSISQNTTTIVSNQYISLDQKAPENYEKYLQIPDELPERVKKLALEITYSAENNFDRAKAIESYLANNYSYTLIPGTTPKDRDFVDYFLFDQKFGYCTYYASAMTVLARSIGIPARYVEGYVLPTQPAQSTSYEVTNKQAHAWVEVYFEGFGWIPFEPTAPLSQNLYGTSERTIAEESNTPDQAETDIIDESIPDQSDNEDNETENETEEGEVAETASNHNGVGVSIGTQALLFTRFLVPVFLVLLPGAAAFSTIKRSLRFHRMQRLTPKQRVIEMYRHLLKVLSIQGFQIKPSETPTQYAHRIDDCMEFNSINFMMVTDIFIKARYSNMAIDEYELLQMTNFYSTLPAWYKERTGWLRYFVYNNLLGLI